jgi:hypothetical protein
VIYSIEGELTLTSQHNKEARIATLAYVLKKLGNPEDWLIHSLMERHARSPPEAGARHKGTLEAVGSSAQFGKALGSGGAC